MTEPKESAASAGPSNFITDIIDADLASGKHTQVVTRFPPEPNGYLHIGHAKSICLNFGIAQKYPGARCHLRFDDTNPAAEDVEYVDAIERDVRWLGFDYGEHRYFASDYFERLHDFAVELIESGKAYVDSVSDAEVKRLRGSVTEPGTPSPYRDRSVEENLDLFARMRAGEFAEGEHVLRAKIDLASPNMKMRDPAIYRIKKAHHHRTGDRWTIYPLYDFTHCLSDAIEGITHSICTLEFENNRELYDWVLDNVDAPCHPQQIEFARLNLSYTLMSKRKLLQLVTEGHVRGWDDPRMPTLAGLRRRGVTPEAIVAFCDMVGVAKANSLVDVGKLEYCIRNDLNPRAPRVMGVLRPLEVIVESYPEGQVEELDAASFPHDVGKEGSRKVPFSRRLFIEASDFDKDPPKGYYRLSPGAEVRLRYAYVVRCTGVEEDAEGRPVRLRCVHDPATRGAAAPEGRRVKGTIHWVSADHAIDAEVRVYDRLFEVERPEGLEDLNPGSLEVIADAKLEPSVKGSAVGQHFQLERQGYFRVDEDSANGKLVLNRTVTLRDTWQKTQDKLAAEAAPQEPEKRAKATKKQPEAPRKEAPPERLTEAEERERGRLVGLGVEEDGARRLVQVAPALALFDATLAAGGVSGEATAKWIVNELLGRLRDGEVKVTGDGLAALLRLVDAGSLKGPAAKRVLAEMVERGGEPEALVASLGIEEVDADALDGILDEVLAAHPEEVARYREGKKNLIGFFLGQVMRKSGGQADPNAARKRLMTRLEA